MLSDRVQLSSAVCGADRRVFCDNHGLEDRRGEALAPLWEGRLLSFLGSEFPRSI